MRDPQSVPKYLVVAVADGDELRWQVRRAGDFATLLRRPSSCEQATALADSLDAGELQVDEYQWMSIGKDGKGVLDGPCIDPPDGAPPGYYCCPTHSNHGPLRRAGTSDAPSSYRSRPGSAAAAIGRFGTVSATENRGSNPRCCRTVGYRPCSNRSPMPVARKALALSGQELGTP